MGLLHPTPHSYAAMALRESEAASLAFARYERAERLGRGRETLKAWREYEGHAALASTYALKAAEEVQPVAIPVDKQSLMWHK